MGTRLTLGVHCLSNHFKFIQLLKFNILVVEPSDKTECKAKGDDLLCAAKNRKGSMHFDTIVWHSDCGKGRLSPVRQFEQKCELLSTLSKIFSNIVQYMHWYMTRTLGWTTSASDHKRDPVPQCHALPPSVTCSVMG